jgi:hypothetical protein
MSGLNFFVESMKESEEDSVYPVRMQIKSVDVIYNPEYEKLV